MTNLYTITAYTFLKSNIKIEHLVTKAKDLGLSSLAITDTNLHAAFKFYNLCLKAGIKPIIGLETEISDSPYLIYAKDDVGYKNLLKLASLKEINGTISLADIGDNIILVTKGDYLDYDFQQLEQFEYYLGIELDDLELELNFAPKIYAKSIELSKKCVILSKTLYVESSGYKYVKALESIDKNEVLSMDDYSVGNQYLHSEDEIKQIYSEYPGLVNNTNDLADSLNVSIDFGDYQLPKYPVKHDAKDYLMALCKKGLDRRLTKISDMKQIYVDRLLKELEIINQMGFNDYFLIVWDFVNYAKRQDILVGPGRGSAAGSLVSYCLGITNTDPIKYDLLFERFLNHARATMPDIDMDFPDDKRDVIIDYVRDKYSLENVSSIVTFGKFAARSSIRDVAKILNLRTEYLDEVLKYVPVNASNLRKLSTGKDLAKLRQNFKEIDQLLDYASSIEGLPRHTSTHAAGIIISDKPITEYTAIQKGIGGIYQSQYEAKDLEEIGLLKIDFLGLSNLKILKNTVDLVKKYENIDINLYDLEYDDKDVFALLASGDTDGVFQLESRGVRDVLRKLKVKDFEDVIATLALYRPGPMENIPEYIKRSHSGEFKYVHPDLESILKPTYGIIVYQEQIINIAHQFAGYTLSEADLLRKAVSKKDHELLENERTRFVQKCALKNYSKEDANQIYDYFVKFANYGFNRSHSVAYAMVAYQCAYMKVKYPKYFMSVLLSNSVGSEKSTEKYLRECRKLGIKILPPDINKSLNTYSVLKDSVQLPLISIKNLGKATTKRIIELRSENEFANYLDFVNRTKGIVNQSLVEKLINASALDQFNLPKKVMINKYADAVKYADYGELIGELSFNYGAKTEFTHDELIDNERNALGFNIKYNFMGKFEDIIKKNNLDSLADIEYKSKIKFIARISKVKKINTKNGKNMAFVTLEDDTRILDSVIFPMEFTQYDKLLIRGECCLFQATMETNRDRTSLIINKIGRLK